MTQLTEFWLCFIPLFVAVDPLGALPMFMGLTEGLERPQVRRVIIQSVVTATAVAFLFLAIGKAVMRLLGITVADFAIAGGILLFVLSLSDLLSLEKKQRHVDAESLGAVPLGVPLIVGPAVLATMILLVDVRGVPATLLAATVNILIAGVAFWFSGPIIRALGKAGSKTISKLSSILLAAIGIMMVRKGVAMFLSEGLF